MSARGRAAAGAVACVAAVLAGAGACAHAAAPPVAITVLGGATVPDARLADYQWDTAPRPALGVEAAVGLGAFAVGPRLATVSSRQSTGGAEPAAAAVRLTSLELIGRRALADAGGVRWSAVAGGGWLHLGYHPDHVTVAAGTGASVVTLAPIDTWIVGAGLAASRALGAHWGVGVEVQRRWFPLDTAHRSGTSVVEQRESFGDWSARLELSRHLTRS